MWITRILAVIAIFVLSAWSSVSLAQEKGVELSSVQTVNGDPGFP
jgi:hypothetical protein